MSNQTIFSDGSVFIAAVVALIPRQRDGYTVLLVATTGTPIEYAKAAWSVAGRDPTLPMVLAGFDVVVDETLPAGDWAVATPIYTVH